MCDQFIIKSRKPSLEISLISVGQFMWKRLQQLNGESICIIEAMSELKLTRKEFISQANSVAIALLNRGVTKSDRICIFSSNCIQYAVLMFASYFLGVTLVPLSPTMGVYELKMALKNMSSIMIFTSVANAKNFDGLFDDFVNFQNEKLQIKSIFVLNGSYGNYLPFEQLLKEGENRILDRIPHFGVDPKKDVFLILGSSGSTGLPKAVMISHYSFVAILNGHIEMNDLICAEIFPFGHVGGSTLLNILFDLGATVILLEEYNENLLLKSVEKYKINLLPLFPAFGRKLVEGDLVDKYDLSSVKMTLTGGAYFDGNIAKAIIKKYNVIFREEYGMTEFTRISQYSNEEAVEYISGNVGHLSPNVELKIMDLNTGQSLGPNIDGEICVRGPKMFLGYLNNISATNEIIDNEGWLHTGDIGHYDEKERLFITDRLKELIKFGTYQVSPAEIEQFLLTHPSVAEVVVIGIKHETETQWPRAYVKVKEDKIVSEEELQKFVAESMGYIKQLRAGVIFVDEIPRISIGKLNRKYFKDLVVNEVIKDNKY